jgi:hypothetical protein
MCSPLPNMNRVNSSFCDKVCIGCGLMLFFVNMSNNTEYLSPAAVVFPFIFSFYLSKRGETILQTKDTFCGRNCGKHIYLGECSIIGRILVIK